MTGGSEPKAMRGMLKRLFHRAQAGPPDGSSWAVVAVGPRSVAACIGDVHGRLDLLLAMEALIETDRREQRASRRCADRPSGRSRRPRLREPQGPRPPGRRRRTPAPGPAPGQPRPVAARVRGRRAGRPGADGELDPLRRRRDAAQLRHQARPAPARGRAVRDGAAGTAASGSRPSMREFLDRLDLAFGLGDYFFCHAGIRPEVPLERQSEADLLWIREPFLSWDGRLRQDRRARPHRGRRAGHHASIGSASTPAPAGPVG